MKNKEVAKISATRDADMIFFIILSPFTYILKYKIKNPTQKGQDKEQK